MTRRELSDLIDEVDTAIDCIEQLDDHSPISAETLRSIRQVLTEADTDD